MNSKFVKLTSIIKLVYEIKTQKTITIFDPHFVNRNKSKCKMIINNKIYLLTDKYQIVDKNKKLLKVKLLVLNNKKIDLSFMFFNCDSLKKFHIISKEENILNEEFDNKNYQSENTNEDYFYDLNNQLNATFEDNNYNDITTLILNQAINIYYDYNNTNENIENEKMNNIINLSNEFLSCTCSSIETNTNNHIEHSSFNENSFSLNSWKIKDLIVMAIYLLKLKLKKKIKLLPLI